MKKKIDFRPIKVTYFQLHMEANKKPVHQIQDQKLLYKYFILSSPKEELKERRQGL